MSFVSFERRPGETASYVDPLAREQDHRAMLARHRSFLEIFRRDVWWAELWSAVAAVGWSLISVIAEGDVVARPGLVGLSNIAGNGVWEAAGIVLGVLHLAALISGYRIARWIACFVMAGWWFFLTLTIMVNDPAAPSGALYTTNAAICLTSLWKLWRPDAE